MRLFKLALPLAVCNWAALFVAAYILDDPVAVHIGFDGTVSYGSKWMLMLLGLLPVLLAVGMLIYRQVTKNRESSRKNRRLENILIPLIVLFLCVVCWLPVAIAYNWPINRSIAILIGIPGSLLFLIMGNYTGVIKPNRNLGLRLPWTLKSDEVWVKTHRMMAKWCVVGGVLFLIGAVLTAINGHIGYLAAGFVAAMFLGLVIPSGYSCWLYHRLQKK